MGKNLLVICDLDCAYASSLSDYMNKKRNVPFEVHTFTRPELLVDFTGEKKIDVLLLCAEAAYELKKMEGDVKADEVFILSEDSNWTQDGEGLYQGCRNLYKYQSAENILREIMRTYADSSRPIPGRMRREPSTKLIGVYSPVKRSLKTSFAMTMGQILSEKKKVLYINLEEYSGFNNLMKKSYVTDMSDLMYYISQGKPNLIWKLASIVQNIGGLDYIPPAISPPDIRSISEKQWLEFFLKLQECDYDLIILDMGETVDGLFEILRMCTRIYSPVRDDAVSYAKMEQYEALLKSMDYEDILEKSRKLSFTHFDSVFKGMDRLVYSELGAYVRKLIRNESDTQGVL